MNYDAMIKRFEEYCNRIKSLTLLCFKFLTAHQNEAETFDEFVARLKTLIQECELEHLQDNLVRDLIIIRTNDYRLQEKLLSEDNLTLKASAGQTTKATKH